MNEFRKACLQPFADAAQLYVVRNRKRYPIASIEEARQKWIEFRDGSGAGCSRIGNGVEIVDCNGTKVASISYNGRAWDAEGKPLDGVDSKQWVAYATGKS